MSSAFKNFFITFAICLVIFSFLGFQYAYPWLDEVFDLSEMGKKNSDNSQTEVSDSGSEVSEEPKDTYYNDDGDVFTAVIIAADSNGRGVKMVFVDSNAKTRQYIHCTIGSNIKGNNTVGQSGQVKDIYASMTPDEICKSVTALTGIETQYCLRFTPDSLSAIAAVIPGASITLPAEIVFTNPEYKDEVYEKEEDKPKDYQLKISNVDNKVLLNEKYEDKTKLEWLLYYNASSECIFDENELYGLIAEALYDQFLANEVSTMNIEVMSRVLASCETNMRADDASKHLATIFSHNDFTYHDVALNPDWADAAKELRDLDGSYNR